MPIIGKVGRKSIRVRLLDSTFHTLLILGGLTMIYPFLIMISASFKSNVDSKEFNIIPKYFHEDTMLFKKYIEARFNEESTLLTSQYKNDFYSFEFVNQPKNRTYLFQDYNEFLNKNKDKYGNYDYYVSEQYGRGVYSKNERKFRDMMHKEAKGKISNFNKKYDMELQSWDELRIEEKNILNKKYQLGASKFLKRYYEFKKSLPLKDKYFASIDGYFISQELLPAFKSDIELLNLEYNLQYSSWKNVVIPDTLSANFPLNKYWIHFVKNVLNPHHIELRNSSNFRIFLKEKYEDISLLNKTYKTNYINFDDISNVNGKFLKNAEIVDFMFFLKNKANPRNIKINSFEIDFRKWLEKKYQNIDILNTKYQFGYDKFNQIKLSNSLPQNNVILKNDWIEFVRNHAEYDSYDLKMNCQNDFLEAMDKIYKNEYGEFDISAYNKDWNSNFSHRINIYPPKHIPKNKEIREVWLKFAKKNISKGYVNIKDENLKWLTFLEQKYKNIDNLNEAFCLTEPNFENINIDYINIDYHYFIQNKKAIFKEFLTRNYIEIIDVMLLNGRAIFNTFWYCLLAIITALVVNPLAAYSMSRFKLKSTYKIILVLMLTMAFPPIVMGIPNFLIMKNLNMLNTFWALILPGAADGYFIFLLKGFFDSLPKELFESATIDGAGEFTIFTKIAMSLSKPIMAVIALSAFNAAYRNFMFAFIVCQDESMWTMMVQIYQLIQRSSSGVSYAALVVASIPTLLVFAFFQNIIIKGIVVPTEK